MKITVIIQRTWGKFTLTFYCCLFCLMKTSQIGSPPPCGHTCTRTGCTCAGVSQGEDLTLAFQIFWIRLLTLIWIAANHRKTSQWWRQLCCDPPQLHVPHPKRAGPQRGRYLNTQQVIARPQILALWTFDSLQTDRTGRIQFILEFHLMLYTLITLWWWPWVSWVWDLLGVVTVDLLAVVPKAYSHILGTSRWDLLLLSFHSVWTSRL